MDEARGESLSRIGLAYGVPRNLYEEDAPYRRRITAMIACLPRAGTRMAILRVATSMLPASVKVELSEEFPQMTFGAPRVVLTLHQPWWRHWLIIPAWRDGRRVRQAVAPQIAAGVVLKVRWWV